MRPDQVREADFQVETIRYLEDGGATVLKLDPGTGTIPKSWPDLLVLRPGGVVEFVEVKAPGGTVTPGQRHTLRMLALAGHRVCFCDPRLDYCIPTPMTVEEIDAYEPPARNARADGGSAR